MQDARDLKIGDRVGSLMVVSADVKDKSGMNAVLFLCLCGNERIIKLGKVFSRDRNRCSCRLAGTHRHVAKKENHGLRKTSEYDAWAGMKKRCLCKTSKAYELYGARGIKVCEEWVRSFSAFIRDMGLKPTQKHSLDRIDNDGDYCPENCRWALPDEQSRNRSSSVFLTVGDKRLHIYEWSKLSGVSPYTIRTRIRNGWAPERAIFTPKQSTRTSKHRT